MDADNSYWCWWIVTAELHFKPVPVAVMTQDWDKLSFSGGRVISENPATTKPCKNQR